MCITSVSATGHVSDTPLLYKRAAHVRGPVYILGPAINLWSCSADITDRNAIPGKPCLISYPQNHRLHRRNNYSSSIEAVANYAISCLVNLVEIN